MAVKVIKGGTRIVKKTVCVEERLADKFLLELTQEELDALVFVLGQRYGEYFGGHILITGPIFDQLASFRSKNYSKEYKIIQYGSGWKVVKKGC